MRVVMVLSEEVRIGPKKKSKEVRSGIIWDCGVISQRLKEIYIPPQLTNQTTKLIHPIHTYHAPKVGPT